MAHAPARFDSTVMKSFPAIFGELKKRGLFTPTLTIEHLKEFLDAGQGSIVDQIISLDPENYGVKTPYAGDLEAVPLDLIVVCGQQYTENGTLKTLDDKYVPRHIYRAFVEMNNAFMADCPKRKLLIESCYRSPAFQVLVFIYNLLHTYKGDVGKTIRRVSPPTYSQHTIASKAAIDFKNIDGSPLEEAPEEFRKTVEYAWLRKHANKFGFYESWLAGNEFGMMAEPWHWQFLGKGHKPVAGARSGGNRQSSDTT